MESFGDMLTLNESLDKPLRFKWVTRQDEVWVGQFTTDGGHLYTVCFEETRPDHYTVDFSMGDGCDGADFGETGTGEQFPVFATVVKMIQQFIKTKKPPVMALTAALDNGPGRARLYKRMLGRFLGKEYSLTVRHSSSVVEFVLKRKKK